MGLILKYFKIKYRLIKIKITLKKIFKQTYGNIESPKYLPELIKAKSPNSIKSDVNNLALEQELAYQKWIQKNEPDEEELNSQRKIKFHYSPRISVICTTCDTLVKNIKPMIDSIINQTYENWELCIASGGKSNTHIDFVLENYSKNDKRIKVAYLKNINNTSVLLNEALNLGDGDYAAFVNNTDLLAIHSLYEVVKSINNNPDAEIIYSDEDTISKDGWIRSNPHFKPDYNPDMLTSYNYISNLFVCKTALGEKAGWFREGFDGSELYDLILRLTEQTNKIIHIPKILYHKRAKSKLENKAIISAKKALFDHLKRVGINGNTGNGLLSLSCKIDYPVKNKPLISIIILNKNHSEDLKRCVQSIIKKSSYKNIEILIVENGSTEVNIFKLYNEFRMISTIKILEWRKRFNFSVMNNFAVKSSGGEVLLFMNNDMEVINSDWLEEMLQHALRKEVGAVGAKLYYPDGTIQHAGVINFLSHAHRYLPKKNPGYFGGAKIIQNFSIMTGACLMMRRDIFSEIRGFNKDFAISYNDFDLCLRLRQKGYLIVWTPYAELYHYESSTTKQYDNDTITNAEAMLFRKRWKQIINKGDPYHSPHLSDDFRIKI